MSFKLRDISIEVSFWFVAVIALMLTLFPESQAFYCFVFCIIHECGHLLAMLFLQRKVTSIKFGYFGIKIFTDRKFLPEMKEASIASGGPVINLFAAAILFIAGQENFAIMNLALAFFNLLPVSILDGGHILSALFPESKSVKTLSTLCSVFLLISGIIIAIYSKKNFTLLIVSLYILTGIIGKKD